MQYAVTTIEVFPAKQNIPVYITERALYKYLDGFKNHRVQTSHVNLKMTIYGTTWKWQKFDLLLRQNYIVLKIEKLPPRLNLRQRHIVNINY